MPSTKIPTSDVACLSDLESCVGDESGAYKTSILDSSSASSSSGSERSHSPKSVVSSLASSEDNDNFSDNGSVAAEALSSSARSTSDEDELEDLPACLDVLRLEEQAEAMMAEHGADMRHVLKTSWKLQPKAQIKLKTKSGKGPGQALRDMATAQKAAIVVEYEKFSRQGGGDSTRSLATSHTIQQRNRIRPPPGFEKMLGLSDADFDPAKLRDRPTPILVSYADGSNTLTLTNEPICVHDITVSCAIDTGHMFITQMKNPTYVGLEPLEAAMFEAFTDEAEAAAAAEGGENDEGSTANTSQLLLRPIATGSLLAVFSDEKWYRCQVVAYNEAADTCDIKFVDHGGYTTVPVSQLRQLRPDFVRLPFQAIEVYIAHVVGATDEVMIDIASDVLFRRPVSIQLLGFTEDNGVPVIQAYFYHNDYIHLFAQEVLDQCYDEYRLAHPDHQVTVPTPYHPPTPLPAVSCSCSTTASLLSSLPSSVTHSATPSNCTAEDAADIREYTTTTAADADLTEAAAASPDYPSSESGVYADSEYFASPEPLPAATTSVDWSEEVEESYPSGAVVATDAVVNCELQPTAAEFYPAAAAAYPILYYVPGDEAGTIFYPVLAAPVYAAAADPSLVPVYTLPLPLQQQQQEYSQEETELLQACVETQSGNYPNLEEYRDNDCHHDGVEEEEEEKPFDQWTQEDYEKFYNL